MACGCALVSTAYKGVFEYASNENAMLSPVNDSYALAENIIRLIENNELRFKLAYKGSEDLKSFSLNLAVDKFEEIIERSKWIIFTRVFFINEW